jgi:hypothetical protein
MRYDFVYSYAALRLAGELGKKVTLFEYPDCSKPAGAVLKSIRANSSIVGRLAAARIFSYGILPLAAKESTHVLWANRDKGKLNAKSANVKNSGRTMRPKQTIGMVIDYPPVASALKNAG